MPAVETLTFANTLRHLRKAAGLTQEALAERAGLSRRGIDDLERGARRSPRKETARLLADALELSGEERAAFLAAATKRATSSPPSLAASSTASAATSVAAAVAPRSGTGALPSGTVTFLFTDIVGSTQLQRRVGPAAYATMRDQHHQLLRSAFAAHGGVEVDTQGDAFFVAFPTAPGALAAAAAATRALATHPWPEGVGSVRVRMGLHTGAPLLTSAGYVGLDVVRAARIAAAGHGGQILLSQTTRDLVASTLPEGVSLRAVGAHHLKDLPEPEPLYQLVLPDPDLPADFPPLKTPDTQRHNLPVQSAPLLGRQEQVAALCALLQREDIRLVTLTGPGGIGKTRLSIQVAADLLDAFPDGVWNVRLSRLTVPALVIPTIAQVFGLKEQGATSVGTLLQSYLRDKRLLLVLDNFEQVVAAAPAVGELLAVCPGVKVLVTSRVPLHLQGERDYALRPLSLPDPAHLPSPEQLSQYAAVALFIERAQAAQADFQVTAQNAPAVAAICARLDGLPLALELAAAWVKLLPPVALLQRLERSLPLLTGGARDVDERQQTMRATLAWSYELLAPEEQRLFRRLAVFVGGCTLEATEAVCVAPEGAPPLETDLLQGLGALLDQSLVQRRAEGGDSAPRFGMLQVVREYALEQLEASVGGSTGGEAGGEGSNEGEALRRAHAAYYVQFVEPVGWRTLYGSEPVEWLAQMEHEVDNVRAALAWAQERGEAETGLRLAVGAARFWGLTARHLEGERWVTEMLALEAHHAVARELSGRDEAGGHAGRKDQRRGQSETRSRAMWAARLWALLYAGQAAVGRADWAAAAIRYEDALAAANAVGEVYGGVVAQTNLGVIMRLQGERERGLTLVEESAVVARQSGDVDALLWALLYPSVWLVGADVIEQMAAWADEGLALARSHHRPYAEATANEGLARIALQRGDLPRADGCARAALTAFWAMGARGKAGDIVWVLALVAGHGGRGERAARLLGASQADYERDGWILAPDEQALATAAIIPAKVALGEVAWQAAFMAGQALALEDAIAEALSE